jgi:hypothetical protein
LREKSDQQEKQLKRNSAQLVDGAAAAVLQANKKKKVSGKSAYEIQAQRMTKHLKTKVIYPAVRAPGVANDDAKRTLGHSGRKKKIYLLIIPKVNMFRFLHVRLFF